MKLFPGAVLALAFIVAAAVTTHSLSAQDAGVYTAQQAAAGAKLFAAQCSECHGTNLEGISGPPLAGKDFTDKWKGQTADDLHYIMSTQMPLTAPGSLSADQYIDLVAFVLQKNHYPAGSTPLTAAQLKNIKIQAQGS